MARPAREAPPIALAAAEAAGSDPVAPDVADDAAGTEGTIELAMAEEGEPKARARPADETFALMSAPAAAQPDAAPAPAAPSIAPAAAIPAAGQKTIRVVPDPRPDQIVLAAVEPAEPPVPLEQEVVSRVSTSGGREFGISLGKYPSRYEAERVLLQTALVEMSMLDEALRKVVNRKGGFDATFVGMTDEMAQLACRRLAARNSECAVIGP